jgi:O-acetyl-ADP-ribose deacetylase (regulator of RNase III)
MSAIRLGTAACVLQFQSLSASLSTGDDVAKDHLNSEALEDEHGRFRVWSGNLGALQKGHSSLDYRLRDSPLLETNILKLLDELRTNLSEALAVVSGSRLPYEKQAKADSDDEDDDWSQNEEDSDEDEESGSPKSELEQRFLDVVDIIDNLYKLSVRIRSPTLRSRSLKAASFRPVDPETGVDTFEQYAVFDAQYTRELLAHIRPPSEQDDSADDYLVERLSKAITLRRRQFKYWRRHRDKLGASTAAADVMLNSLLVTPDLTSPKTTPEDSTIKQEFTTTNPLPPSDWAPKSMLSGTEATQHHHSLDEIVDSQSVTSYATTTRDLTGHGIELPPPPTQAVEDRDFECPYCYIICPARYGRGRPWRTHLLQDLQPYVCTYEDCPLGDQLFRSRREWIEHEAGHRKLWRCPEHKDCVYRSSSGLEDHLHSAHLGIFPEDQIKSIVRVGETSSVDLRPKCPLCLADATMEGGLQNHIANHLERFAAFALPKDIDTAEDRSDGASSMASRGRSEAYSASQDLSDDDDEDEEEEPSEVDWDDADLQIPSGNLSSKIQQLSGKIEFLDMQSDEPRPRPTYSLSSDLLNLLPDSRTRNMDEFLASAEGLPDGLLAEIGQHRGDADATTPGSFPRSSRTARLVFEGLPHPLTGMLQQFLKARPGCRSMSSLTFSEEECSGYAKFTDNMSATNALEAIDVSQYPGVRFNIIKKLAPSTRFADFATIHEHVDNGDSDSDSGLAIKPQKGPAGDSVFAPGGPIKMQKGILPLTDIRTLQQLYADQWLPDHKPRSTPSEAFNHKISLIFKDITSLQVDAIVNASGRNLARSNSHLGRLVHKIAGPALKKELKDIKPFRTIGEAVITDAYNLPCKKIIHSVRPHYASSMDEVSQGLLAQCYRSALELAEQNQLRTIAFPTLSAGGFGFPSSKAATVAIETVRKYLDSGKGITLDRIVFCVFTERDWQAYWRLLPIFFPATSGSSSVPTWEVSNVPSTENTDLEVGPSTKELSTPYSQHRYPAYAKELGELQEQIEGISEDLIVFRDKVPDFQSNIIRELTFIASTVAELGKFFASFSAGPVNTMTDHRAADLLLICSVLRSYCGGITEIMMQTTYTRNVGVPTYADIWQSYTFHLANSQGLTPLGVVELCGNFIQSVADIIKWNGREPDDMGLLRDQLSRYRQKQTGSSIPDFPTTKVFDETLLAREFNAPESWKAPDSWEVKDKQTNILRANQIPTLSRLYQLGELDDTVPTMFSPSSHANNTLCLIRHDITRLQVDAIVNSTDMSCSGNGVLDAAIFKAGGLTMQEDCTKFGILKEGGVRLSQGYLLPCRHVIHTVPPEFYNNRTEPLLRSCYRDALKMAVDIGARTIAFPAIGSGLLMFPREAAQVGVVEMRNFLDQNPDTRIEKILICVFGEHEDNMYRKLLP